MNKKEQSLLFLIIIVLAFSIIININDRPKELDLSSMGIKTLMQEGISIEALVEGSELLSETLGFKIYVIPDLNKRELYVVLDEEHEKELEEFVAAMYTSLIGTDEWDGVSIIMVGRTMGRKYTMTLLEAENIKKTYKEQN